MINFAALPGGKPGYSNPPKGQYIGVISKAEMKIPKDINKNAYLSITFDLTDNTGKSYGKIFDILTESDNEYIRYKMKRLIEALELPITGNFELKDLAKMIQGKKLRLDVTLDERNDPPKAIVDIFANEIFYPLEETQATIQANDALDEDVADVFGADTPTDTTY